MTNDELNKRVAELRGRTIIETQEECSGLTPGATWVSGGDYYECTMVWAIPSQWVDLFHNDPGSIDWYQYQGVPDYCTDPAEWGRLFVEMHKQNLEPELDSRFPEGDDAFGALAYESHECNIQRGGGPRRVIECWGNTPGRALALAYVASQEAKK